jgi:NitT/TauT family transport system substrate-binding protein
VAKKAKMMFKHHLKYALLPFLLLLHCQPKPVTLRVLLLPFLSYAPFLIAEEEGYFAQQGLQVEFVKLIRTDDAIPALVQGKLDVAAGPVSVGILNAMLRGAKIKFVADKGYVAPEGCAYFGLIARRALVEGGELERPTQLQGRRLDVNRVSLEGYYVEKLLKTVGLTINDVEIVDVPPPVESEALEKGTIDLAAMSEPWLTRTLQAEHGVLWMPAQQVIPDFQFAFILYGPILLEKNPDIGKRFMVAYLKAVRQYNQGKTERNLEILAEHTGLDRELLNQACWLPMRNDGRIYVQSVFDFQAWAVEKGFLDSKVTEEQFWDASFVEHANQVLNRPTR